MDLQCWCWGCDIRRASGNLLVRYGASRVRPVDVRATRSTAYHIENRDVWLALWGFGLAIVPVRGLPVVLFRYEPAPRIVRDVDALRAVSCPAELPTHEASDAVPAWWSALTAFKWIASYECWVLESVGARWRRDCVDRFTAPLPASRDCLVEAWDGVNARLERAILAAAGPGSRGSGS